MRDQDKENDPELISKARKGVTARQSAFWTPTRAMVGYPTYFAAAICFLAIFLIACQTIFPDSPEISGYNAYWNCPTPSPVPTTCWQEPTVPVPTVGDGTPTAEPIIECGTPLPTATPYGLQMMPDAHTTSTFFMGQQVRMGPLRISLTAYATTDPISTPGPSGTDQGTVAHVWTFEVANEGTAVLTITWPIRTLMREVALPTGDVISGRWGYTERAGSAANAAWQDSLSVLRAGETRTIRIPIEGPPGRGIAVGFAPDIANPDIRYDAGTAENIIWFRPASDPYCRDNTAGPVTSADQGGAVWQHPLQTRTPVMEGSFQGWPVSRGTYVSQDFGCTSFPEIAGYDCPPGRPWFHAGVDFAAARGTPLYAVANGTVTYVGVSQGVRCTFPGAEEPRTNLGWVIVIQSGAYTIKYGHTIVGSEEVEAGDYVAPGQLLGLMGSTGCSTGPHLHFQVQLPDQRFVDPFNLLGVNSGSSQNDESSYSVDSNSVARK